jgi:UDP-2,3-diacylglucosamine pyrophosphatase LpxH
MAETSPLSAPPPDVAKFPPPPRYLVLSDMHFGTPESNINESTLNDSLVRYIVAGAPWQEIIFTGDLLDANLSTFARAIEGGQWEDNSKPLFGFRAFLSALDTGAKQRPNLEKAGLCGVAKRWVYIPGNHDYKVWDILSTDVAFTQVLKTGQRLPQHGTVRSQTWVGLTSFFAGIFVPFQAERDVLVSYPDHEVTFTVMGQGEPSKRSMLFTHGHYLDSSQSWLSGIRKRFAAAYTPEEIAAVSRAFFIETAQYQTVANAVSFTRRSRGLVNKIVGPKGSLSTFEKISAWIRALPFRWLFRNEKKDGGKLDDHLEAIETYVRNFATCSRSPAWFVFGHTHRQGHGRTHQPEMDVYNAGSCYRDGEKCISFAQIGTASNGSPTVELRYLDVAGVVR